MGLFTVRIRAFTKVDLGVQFRRAFIVQWNPHTDRLPFQTTQNFLINIGEEFTWSNYPGANDIYLEFEYWDMDHLGSSMRKMTRKTSRSLAGVDFSTNTWQELSITIEPKTEGVGYLRLYWGKVRENNKVNTFYVDPKVVVY